MKRSFLPAVLLVATFAAPASETESSPSPGDEPTALSASVKPASKSAATSDDENPESVRWKSLFKHSLRFLVVENGFRYATEAATRKPGLPYFKGYADSVTNLHGWSDSNPFLDNYIGHPMQGAVSGYIWTLNDPRYRHVEFGKDPDYWKSRLRAGAFAWVYSTQLEIGPFSEASVGNIQAKPPEQGFIDHVLTPTLGLAWLIGEDMVDRFLIRKLERRTTNRYYLAVIRGGLNPTRSFANAMSGRWPWRRIADESERFLDRSARSSNRPRPPVEPKPGVAPFELGFNSYFLHATNGPCIGGGSTAAFRIHSQWQIVGDVNGCQMSGMPTNVSGGSMTYTAGPRWTPRLPGRWHPYFQLLAGGTKVTQGVLLPELKAALELKVARRATELPDRSQYTLESDDAGFAMTAGAGLDLQLNNALAIRIVSVDYTRNWVDNLPGFAAPKGLQVKAGIVLRMGTW